MDLSKLLAVLALVIGAGIYLAAVSGALFTESTPAGDVGALTTLVMGLLFGGLALLLARKPKPAGA